MKGIGSVTTVLLLLATVGASEAPAQDGADVASPRAAAGATDDPPTAATALDRLKRTSASGAPLTPPGVEFAAVGVRRAAPSPGLSATALLQQSRRSGLTWMLVGASLVGAGLLIEGDAGTAISVGGALIGAYGVYLLVRR